MATQIDRPRFYEGQYLDARDLTTAVEYTRIRDARHLLGAHTWGIHIGLALKHSVSGGQTSVFVQPGYAFDGLGRPIVVLAPYAISAELFRALVYDPLIDEPNGRLVEVWLRYREVQTGEPRPGFEVCNDDEQTSRIQETFIIEAGERKNPSDRRDNIIVAGTSVSPDRAFREFDASDPLIYDESIPHQNIPDAGARRKWLVPLGYVRWKPNPVAGSPGQFLALQPGDSEAAAALRVYAGVIAGGVHAAGTSIRLKKRTQPPSAVRSADLVWVEGDLRVEGSARLFNGQVEFLDALGQNQGVPIALARGGDNQAGGKRLEMQIGTAEAGDNKLAVGPVVGNVFTPKFVVRDNGNIGLGTAAPEEAMEIGNGGNLLLKGGGEDAGDLIFRNAAGVQKGRVWTDSNPVNSLFLSSADTTPDVTIDPAGLVGIGTTTPNCALTIEGAAGTYLNVRAAGGAQEVLVGADGAGGIVSTMTNHDLQLRAGANITHMVVKSTGNIGVGTTTPATKLHVVGARIRLENGSKQIELRTDGSAVDLESSTNDLYLRANGPAGNNRVIINPLGGDGNVGVGLQSPECKFHVRGNVTGAPGPLANYVAVIENASSDSEADVLALKTNVGAASPTNNYISFFAGATIAGRIEGTPLGGMAFLSGSGDFAECLPRADLSEWLEEGDVVGVLAGRVSKVTAEAHHVAAITARPVVVGNAPAQQDAHRFARVAFMGQVPVKVRGCVQAGDFIVASGFNDGTAVAIPPHEFVRSGHGHVIGTAWDSADGAGLHRINTVIGLQSASAIEPLVASMMAQTKEMDSLKLELTKLKKLVSERNGNGSD